MKKLTHFIPAFFFGMVLQTLLDATIGKEQPSYTPNVWWVIWGVFVMLGFYVMSVWFYQEWKKFNP